MLELLVLAAVGGMLFLSGCGGQPSPSATPTGAPPSATPIPTPAFVLGALIPELSPIPQLRAGETVSLGGVNYQMVVQDPQALARTIGGAGLGLKMRQRPPVERIHIVCAEAMPGEYDLLGEFVRDLKPAVLGNLVRDVWEKMRLAGEAGSLLKIEQEIQDSVRQAREALAQMPPAIQLTLFGPQPPQQLPLRLDPRDLHDEAFWAEAESRVVEALRAYARRIGNGRGVSRRLFAEDALQGMALVDLLQQPFDVVLMNPPFGAASAASKEYIARAYPRTRNDLYAAFVERGLELLRPSGYLGAITSRTGFFLTSFQQWREEILLQEARLIALADLGYGVLDTAMVETAAYVLRKEGSLCCSD